MNAIPEITTVPNSVRSQVADIWRELFNAHATPNQIIDRFALEIVERDSRAARIARKDRRKRLERTKGLEPAYHKVGGVIAQEIMTYE